MHNCELVCYIPVCLLGVADPPSSFATDTFAIFGDLLQIGSRIGQPTTSSWKIWWVKHQCGHFHLEMHDDSPHHIPIGNIMNASIGFSLTIRLPSII